MILPFVKPDGDAPFCEAPVFADIGAGPHHGQFHARPDAADLARWGHL
jgi:hypothetical protein